RAALPGPPLGPSGGAAGAAGHGNAALTPEVLYSAEVIADRVRELGAAITRQHRGHELVVIGVLKGAFVFLSALVRAIDLPVRVEFLAVSSYGAGTETSGEVQIVTDLTRPIAGENVLVVEDIVDTGLTMRYLLDLLRSRHPASLEVCALLRKP